MAPPQLARDAPVLDVFQPMLVGVLVFRGIELYLVVHHGSESQVGKVPHLQEPLHRQFRLNGHARALGATHLVRVVLHLLHQAGSLKVFLYLLAHIEAVHAHIQAGGLAERAVVVEDVYALQLVLLAQHIVVHIVGRRHLQATRTELHVHVVVLYHGNHSAHKRHDNFLALQPGVFRVIGIDTHGRVAHDGLRTRRGHHGVLLQ